MKMISKILICIPTYNRTKSLIDCIKSIKKLKNNKFFDIQILIVDNSINNNSYKVVKKFNKKNCLKIYQTHEKKRGIVHARNKCLQIARKLKPNYVGFIDDDCAIDKDWLKNIYKLLNKINADIITGPQLYKGEGENNFTYLFEKKYKKKLLKVKWAASNNVIFKFDILKEQKNIKFDKCLNKFGIGEDQLFFSMLDKIGYKIYWSKEVFVTEKLHPHRSDLNWIKERSKRLGILGHYLDLKIHGKMCGYFVNYIKSFYLFFYSIMIYINIFNKNKNLELANNFYRFYGKLIGPFKFTRVDFLDKKYTTSKL
jgi:succinoglycan biosynthesis protein ExoM